MIIAKKEDILEARKIIEKIDAKEIDEELINRIMSHLSMIANCHFVYDQCTRTIPAGKFTNVLELRDDKLFKVELESRNTDIVETFKSFFKLVATLSTSSVACIDYIQDEEVNTPDDDEDDEDDDDF